MDAISMYTNIHFGHAQPIIFDFLENNTKGIYIVEEDNIPVKALLHALEIVMKKNILQFGDTYWLQIVSTATGGPSP